MKRKLLMQLCSQSGIWNAFAECYILCGCCTTFTLYNKRDKHFFRLCETLEQLQLALPVGADQTSTVSLCSIVIMEGNPHPGAVKGRMSFQNFNPSIDVSLEGFLLYMSLWLLCPCRFVFPYKSLDM